MLPDIDDGPSDLEQSLELARAAVASGTTTIAATPHLRPDFPAVHVNELAERCQTVREALARERIPLEIVSGAEVSLAWALEAGDDELRLASYGQRGTDLLLETPSGPIVGLDRFMYLLRARGYRITLGHPERSRHFQSDIEPLRALIDQGTLLQVNADSLVDRGARAVTRVVRQLLAEGLAHVIASDGHRGTSWRPVTHLAEAADNAAELVGPERSHWMASAAPAAILSGAELPEPPPLVPQRKRGGLFKSLKSGLSR